MPFAKKTPNSRWRKQSGPKQLHHAHFAAAGNEVTWDDEASVDHGRRNEVPLPHKWYEDQEEINRPPFDQKMHPSRPPQGAA